MSTRPLNPARPGDGCLSVLFLSGGLVALCLGLIGCDGRLPTQPTPQPTAPAPTSQVTSWPDGLTLDHDPLAPGVSVCITQPRQYSSETESYWVHDYYTVVAPAQCPAGPIE